MRILLLGSDTPIGYSLRAFMTPLQRHELISVPLEATRWRRERQVKKLLRLHDCDLVLDVRIISLIEGSDRVGQPDIERTQWLANLCGKLNVKHFQISSARVFSGQLQRTYKETDPADATDTVGELLIATENLLQSQLDDSFILRIGKVFAGRRPSSMTRMLDKWRKGENLVMSDRSRDSPVHSAEVARVVAGIIDQISVGAPSRGIYHYCSQGETGYYAFAEALVAHASQFETFAHARDFLKKSDDEAYAGFNRSLDCTAIRHEFGIQQLPWRDFIERAVRRYIELEVQESMK